MFQNKKNEELNELADIVDYLEEIKYELLNKLDEYNIFRVKYYNKYLYTKGNFVVDTNSFINDLQSLDSINEEYLQINTLKFKLK